MRLAQSPEYRTHGLNHPHPDLTMRPRRRVQAEGRLCKTDRLEPDVDDEQARSFHDTAARQPLTQECANIDNLGFRAAVRACRG